MPLGKRKQIKKIDAFEYKEQGGQFSYETFWVQIWRVMVQHIFIMQKWNSAFMIKFLQSGEYWLIYRWLTPFSQHFHIPLHLWPQMDVSEVSIQDWNMAIDALIPGELLHRLIYLPQWNTVTLSREWIVGWCPTQD